MKSKENRKFEKKLFLYILLLLIFTLNTYELNNKSGKEQKKVSRNSIKYRHHLIKRFQFFSFDFDSDTFLTSAIYA